MHLPSILTSGALNAGLASLPERHAQEIALRRYGLIGELKRFVAEKDDTFKIIISGRSDAFVLKVANPAEKLSEIDFQIELLRHLEAQAPSLPVPRVLRDKNGDWRSIYQAPDGTERIVRLISYIEGIPLDSTDCSAEEREQIGQMLARLRLAMAGFTHLGQTRELAWNVEHLQRLAPLLSEIEDKEQRRLLSIGLERFIHTTGAISRLRHQVLHNDFSRSNIVVDHGEFPFIRGIIDFGDAVDTAIAIDVSTALLNQLPERAADDPFSGGRDLLRGYLTIADLTYEELALIPHLTMGRVIARALITIWRARLFRDNSKYILRNTEQGWWQLKWFLDRTVDEVSDSLMSYARI